MGFLDRIQSMLQGSKLDVEQRFEILREAVSGTMSKFYVARDRTNDKVVGLKIGDQEKVDAFEARFKGLKKPSEGEIAKSMQHPNIVVTHEYGLTTKNLPYLIMDFVKGPGLHALIAMRDPVLEGKRLKIILQMADAIKYVHESGYIHRDICPRNFICAPDAVSVTMIDFGLTVPDQKEFRQPGNRTGTPLYMAPEVVRRRWTDQRLDVFSFGVTAYHLCALVLPWPGSDTTGMAALAHDTVHATDILKHAPTLNKTLARAIMGCIEPNVEKRTESMAAFFRHLKGVESEYA